MSIYAARIEAIALALMLGGCEAPLAELVEHRGVVERDPAAAPERWERARDGDELGAGDGLRTQRGASAVLQLAGGRLSLEERTVIRLRLGEDATAIDVASGQAVLEADRRLELHTAVGDAVFEPGTRVSLSGGGAPNMVVLLGRATVGDDELLAGQSLHVRIGGAQLEPGSADGHDEQGARISVRGRARLRGPSDSGWRALAEGESHVSAGARVALEAAARAVVHRGASRVAVTGPAELRIGGPGAALVTTGAGHARLDALGGDVALDAPGGRITATAGARADVHIDGTSTRVLAERGRVRIVHEGTTSWLEPGEQLTVAHPPPPAPLGPERAHLSAGAGESFTVHTSRSPIVVELAVARCPHEAVIEASGQRTRGAGHVRVALEVGRHPYEVRCRGADGALSSEPVASGRIRVVRDDGRAPVPHVPPIAHVAIDGRPYTVLFQGVLPRVIVTVPPGGRAPYTLSLARGGGARERTSDTPRFDLPPGTLLEGTYIARVRDASGASTPATRLTLQLDEAAPTASIIEPEDGAFVAGRATRVVGVTQRGWTVDVEGRALAVDPRRRFGGETIARAERGALAIRLRHPRRGVHYYLRFARER